MEFAIGIVVLVLGLLASIALHEVGHLVPAKRFGVRVSQYMVGFGPTLWSRTVGETEYGLKAIPLGGYVRLVGMLPTAEAVGARPRPGRIAEVVQAAREQSAEEIAPGEEHRAFYRLDPARKVVVMLGGPLMNLVLAAVLVAIVLMGIGVPSGGPTTTVAYVAPCMLPYDAPADRTCTEADEPTPAAAAGLEPGDVFVSWDGRPVEDWTDFQEAVTGNDGTPSTLVVDRAGEQVALEITPVVTERPVVEDEEAVTDETGAVVTEETPFVGVSPTAAVERQGVGDVLGTVGTVTWESMKAIVTLPARVVEVGQSVFGGGERSASSIVGLVGVGRLAGDIAATDTPYGTSGTASNLLMLLASLNVFLCVFNLIPLVPFDGGHVAGALWEGVKRTVARLRGLPRPAPADVARTLPVAYGVVVVLLGLFAFLVYADLVRPVVI